MIPRSKSFAAGGNGGLCWTVAYGSQVEALTSDLGFFSKP